LTDDIRQQTLSAHLASHPELSGRRRLLELVSRRVIELSRAKPSPLTPSLALTERVLSSAERCGLIVRPGASDASHSTTVRSVYEDVSWALQSSEPPNASAEKELRRYVHDTLNRSHIRQEQLDLWMQLAEAEIDGYVQHLLRHHPARRELSNALNAGAKAAVPHASISAVRRALWIHLRGPESTSLEAVCPGDPSRWARMFAARVASAAMALHGRSDTARFVPSSAQPRPLMRTIFQTEATRLGLQYWTSTPALIALHTDAF